MKAIIIGGGIGGLSTLQIFMNNKNLKDAAFSYDVIGGVYNKIGKQDEAVRHYQQALEISQQIKDEDQEATILIYPGGIYKNLGQYDKTMENYEKALSLYRKLNRLSDEARTLFYISLLLKGPLCRYDEALKYSMQALEIYRKIKELEDEAFMLGHIGSIFKDLSQHEKAREYYQQAMTLSQKIGDKDGEATMVERIGSSYKNVGQYKKALEFYKRAQEMYRGIHHVISEALILNNIGQVYYEMGQYEMATSCHEQALEFFRKVRELNYQASTLTLIAINYMGLFRYHEALKIDQEALEIYRKIGNMDGELTTLRHVHLRLNLCAREDHPGRPAARVVRPRRLADLRPRNDAGARSGPGPHLPLRPDLAFGAADQSRRRERKPSSAVTMPPTSNACGPTPASSATTSRCAPCSLSNFAPGTRTASESTSRAATASGGLTHGLKLELDEILRQAGIGDERLATAEGFLASLRGRKTPREVEALRSAVGTTEQLIAAWAPKIRVGRSERELADGLHAHMRALGLQPSWDWETDPAVNTGPLSEIGHAGRSGLTVEARSRRTRAAAREPASRRSSHARPHSG